MRNEESITNFAGHNLRCSVVIENEDDSPRKFIKQFEVSLFQISDSIKCINV